VRGSEDGKKRDEGLARGKRGERERERVLASQSPTHHLDLILVVVISFIVDEAQIG
jgi:hypothetical protein